MKILQLLLHLYIFLHNILDANAFSGATPSSSRHSLMKIFSAAPQPRRNLKKRRNRRRRHEKIDDFPWDTAESRPLVQSSRIEAGEDYWIDEKELEESLKREEEAKNRKPIEGEISQDKLWEETLAPYKQNWIGYFSVFIVTVATIVIKFPELLDPPSPLIPDL
eukprot:CAMPEP_0194201810 /NCGR_PEP_ID=MMETSP0156-20130528/1980_1 /TAXON_ID=33649 /ORGANISM="Thalassionema nitzschioides, Strain L26-B" /LENGTH=163 /DNA_ID=CAMNT_0038927105 /DNA_START=116 /DNA_END=607 /DNA_ORIENTATION=-